MKRLVCMGMVLLTWAGAEAKPEPDRVRVYGSPQFLRLEGAEACPDGAQGIEVPEAADGSASALWKPGKWANFTAAANHAVATAAEEVFIRQGRLFVDLEVEVKPRAGERVADLVVTAAAEGLPSVLGKVHVTGNVINRDEEVHHFLELDRPGKALAGDFVGDMKRRLLESGRFLGYEIVPHRPKKEAAEVRGPRRDRAGEDGFS